MSNAPLGYNMRAEREAKMLIEKDKQRVVASMELLITDLKPHMNGAAGAGAKTIAEIASLCGYSYYNNHSNMHAKDLLCMHLQEAGLGDILDNVKRGKYYIN